MDDEPVDVEWIDGLRGEYESKKEWAIKRSFLVAHYNTFSRERLLCLANCFINMEMYGCRYPQDVMMEINGLAAQLSEFVDYKKEKLEREAKRIKFVKESSGNDRKVENKSVNLISFVKPKDTDEVAVKNDNVSEQTDNQLNPTEIENNKVRPTDREESPTSKNVELSLREWRFPSLMEPYSEIYEKVHQFIVISCSSLDDILNLPSRDISKSLILTHMPCQRSDTMLAFSLRNCGHSTSSYCDEDSKRYTFCINDTPVAWLSIRVVQSNSNLLKSKHKSGRELSDLLISHHVLYYLLPRCWIVTRKDPVGDNAITADDLMSHNKAGSSSAGDTKAMSMLKALGWQEGDGLGSKRQGITQPVSVETVINREGLGFQSSDACLRKYANELFTDYVKSERTDVLVFSKDFTSDDRKVLHMVASKFNLKTKSRGKDSNRCLTVTRKGLTSNQLYTPLVQKGILESDCFILTPPGEIPELNT